MVIGRTRAGAIAAGLVLGGCAERPRHRDGFVSPPLVVFADAFEGDHLDPAWRPSGPAPELRDGRLHVEGLRNHPVWLQTPLPDDVRIEFDAWADSDEADVKVELAGDGRSHATGPRYTASGYVVIFGGWHNSTHALVRRDEHGRDRVTRSEPPVQRGRRYHFVLTRRGPDLWWEIDGFPVLHLHDPAPLQGEGQRHFGIGGWEAPTHFDNLSIEALPS